MERSNQKIARRIAAVLILMMGIALVHDRSGLLLAGHNSLTWPSVQGTVITARAEPLAGSRVGSGWRVHVNYVYDLDQTRFSGDRLRFSQRIGDMTQAEAELAMTEFVPDSPIELRYDPEQPARSVIRPGPDRQAWFGLFVGIILCLIAVVFWVVPTKSQPADSGS
ncbi:MAG: DUF3592 domain-containing protein [Wenzhouxiangella sp.]|nr:DUF3592 domain-containing protein [Wenzhouxiangella sp.]